MRAGRCVVSREDHRRWVGARSRSSSLSWIKAVAGRTIESPAQYSKPRACESSVAIRMKAEKVRRELTDAVEIRKE